MAECNEATVQRSQLERDQLIGAALADAVLDIETARRCALTTYKEIADAAGWEGIGASFAGKVGKLLFAINEAERDAGRPMLGAVVVNKRPNSRLKSSKQGFFACARELGLLPENASAEDEERFLKDQLRMVYKAWAV